MWALVDKNTKVVIACIHNKRHSEGHTYEEALKIAGNNILVEMTLENSPAYINGTWDGKKFYEKKEEN
jgi:hypothetical protein